MCAMKNLQKILLAAVIAVVASGCTSAYFSQVSTYDDLYATHDVKAIAERQKAEAEVRKAEAEAAKAEAEALIAQRKAEAAEYEAKIAAINRPVNMVIMVSLSCTMCPDLVVATQRIAAENPRITAEVYDIRHFEEIKNRFNVMSVPCLVVNDEKVSFGKKNIPQILDLLA